MVGYGQFTVIDLTKLANQEVALGIIVSANVGIRHWWTEGIWLVVIPYLVDVYGKETWHWVDRNAQNMAMLAGKGQNKREFILYGKA